jgi:pyruvate dehydrogenase E2 component (dihydrolipoamide acetyltransferase)
MSKNLLMPALSPTMEEGILIKWLVKEGDEILAGDLIAEIETDKATMEIEATDDGIIGELLVEAGTLAIKVNSPIATVLTKGETVETPEAENQSAKNNNTEEKVKLNTTENFTLLKPEGHEVKNLSAALPKKTISRVFASPLARRIAKEMKLDINEIKGSGPNGRIINADVLNISVISGNKSSLKTKSELNDVNSIDGIYASRPSTNIPLDGMRRAISARLTESKSSIPHFYLRQNISIDNLQSLRLKLNKALSTRGIKISINDFIIKASALALQETPDANVIWAQDHIINLKESDISVAVAIEGGLLTPIIFNSDSKSLIEISIEMKSLANKARERKLLPSEYQGGSFSISNLGMYGIESFDAIINPPQSVILAVGAGIKKAVVNKITGELSVETLMSVTLSVDHRAIDGALGAKLLNSIKSNLENPEIMLI